MTLRRVNLAVSCATAKDAADAATTASAMTRRNDDVRCMCASVQPPTPLPADFSRPFTASAAASRMLPPRAILRRQLSHPGRLAGLPCLARPYGCASLKRRVDLPRYRGQESRCRPLSRPDPAPVRGRSTCLREISASMAMGTVIAACKRRPALPYTEDLGPRQI